MRASVRFDHELLAVEHDHDVSCMLELLAPPAPEQAERRPLALSLVIDRSGSMAGPKLDVTQRCAAFLVEHLAPGDQLSIVSFDDEVRIEAPLVLVEPNRGQLLAAINGIVPGGSTNLSGGWLKGIEVLTAVNGDSVTRRVLLLTDGQANVGINDAGQLAKMTRASAADGIGTTTIGFGDGFSEDLLAGMADGGGGGAYFAETPDAAPGIFAQEFADLMSLVAQNVSVESAPRGRTSSCSPSTTTSPRCRWSEACSSCSATPTARNVAASCSSCTYLALTHSAPRRSPTWWCATWRSASRSRCTS